MIFSAEWKAACSTRGGSASNIRSAERMSSSALLSQRRASAHWARNGRPPSADHGSADSEARQAPRHKKSIIVSVSDTLLHHADTNELAGMRTKLKASDPLEIFQRGVCRNVHMAEELKRRQMGLCPICTRSLGKQETVIHHLEYAHECSWHSLKTLDAPPRHNLPDCLGCQADDSHRFDACCRRLLLLHRRCHLAFHRGEKVLISHSGARTCGSQFFAEKAKSRTLA